MASPPIFQNMPSLNFLAQRKVCSKLQLRRRRCSSRNPMNQAFTSVGTLVLARVWPASRFSLPRPLPTLTALQRPLPPLSRCSPLHCARQHPHRRRSSRAHGAHPSQLTVAVHRLVTALRYATLDAGFSSDPSCLRRVGAPRDVQQPRTCDAPLLAT